MALAPRLLAALGISDDHAPLHLLGEAAYARLYQGRTDDAGKIFLALAALLPQAPVGFLGLAEVRLAEGNSAQALTLATSAMELSTMDEQGLALALDLCARARLQCGDLAGAREAFHEGSQLCADAPLTKALSSWLAAVTTPQPSSTADRGLP